MICPYGGLPISRHNEIRDITTKWLTDVCTDVEKEPQLQPLTGETILPRSANKQEEARVDIKAKGFWNRQQNAFFDVGSFTQTHRATEKQRSQHSKWSMRYSHHLFFLQLVDKGKRQPSHINDWQNCWQRSENQNTASLLHGCDVSFLSP